MKWLFAFLLALNLGFFGWHHLQPQRGAAPAPAPRAATIPGVSGLVLLAEVPPERLQPVVKAPAKPEPEPVVAPEPPAPELSVQCYRIGPLASAEAADTFAAWWSKQGVAVGREQTERQVFLGHWVFIRPVESNEAARALLSEIKGRGITDIYVVMSGTMRRAISLGLYSRAAEAEARVAHLKSLGYPVEVSEQQRTEVDHWLVVGDAEGGADEAQWRRFAQAHGAPAHAIEPCR